MTENIYKKIGSIRFKVLSPKLIKKMASAKVVTPELYDKEGYPVDGFPPGTCSLNNIVVLAVIG